MSGTAPHVSRNGRRVPLLLLLGAALVVGCQNGAAERAGDGSTGGPRTSTRSESPVPAGSRPKETEPVWQAEAPLELPPPARLSDMPWTEIGPELDAGWASAALLSPDVDPLEVEEGSQDLFRAAARGALTRSLAPALADGVGDWRFVEARATPLTDRTRAPVPTEWYAAGRADVSGVLRQTGRPDCRLDGHVARSGPAVALVLCTAGPADDGLVAALPAAVCRLPEGASLPAGSTEEVLGGAVWRADVPVLASGGVRWSRIACWSDGTTAVLVMDVPPADASGKLMNGPARFHPPPPGKGSLSLSVNRPHLWACLGALEGPDPTPR